MPSSLHSLPVLLALLALLLLASTEGRLLHRTGSGIGHQSQQALASDVDSAVRDGHLLAKGALHDAEAVVQQQPVASTVTVSSKNYFERLADSFVTALLGFVGVIFSVPLLWINERRNARMECTLMQGRSDCISVNTAKEENRGRLVHIDGEQTKQAAVVADEAFSDVRLQESCLRLRTAVEIFQWVEHSETKKEERLGGTETTVTVYTYTQEWSTTWHDSSQFKQSQGHQNTAPVGLNPRSSTINCSRVEYAGNFLLPEELVSQLGGFQPAGQLLGSSVHTAAGGHTLQRAEGDNRYYLRERAPGTAPAEVLRSPEIGDVRVSFEVVKPGPATVLALQTHSKGGEAMDTFLPYRLISKGICGLSEEQEKQRRLEQGQRTASDMADDDNCGCGPFSLLCCACNCVSWCMSATLQPELFHCFDGSMGKTSCFAVVEQRNKLTTWFIRLGGWLLMYVGLYAMFSPIITLLAVIPFIKTLGATAIWILCFLVTLVVASLIIFMAYLVYHPLLAFGALLVVALGLATPKLIGLAMAK